jgi:hypothetical protein
MLTFIAKFYFQFINTKFYHPFLNSLKFQLIGNKRMSRYSYGAAPGRAGGSCEGGGLLSVWTTKIWIGRHLSDIFIFDLQ